MKAFKNRLEEMAEATVNALDYSDSKVAHFSFKESSERI